MDFNQFYEFINRIDYKGDFTVEATAFDSEGVIDVEMLNEQFRSIREMLGVKDGLHIYNRKL